MKEKSDKVKGRGDQSRENGTAQKRGRGDPMGY